MRCARSVLATLANSNRLVDMAQYIYTMNRVGKVVPPKREILKDISLSFFPGAKIGVIGLNGSGKSPLLRIMAGFDKLLAEQATLQDKIETAGAWDLERNLDVAAEALRLPPGEADVRTLSGGERRRVALCKLLLSAPDMLLLDEPTNHLDTESVAWLERFLEEYTGTVI